MIKTKEKNTICKLSGALFIIFLIINIVSIKANALGVIVPGGKDTTLGGGNSGTSKLTAIWEGVPTYAIGKINPPKASFTTGTTQADWYAQHTTNMVFYQQYHGLTWYSPLPDPQNVNDKTTKSYSQMYENATKIASLDDRGKSLLADQSYTNFKVYSSPINDCTFNSLTKGGFWKNDYDPYKGQSGEWRYMGYSRQGNVVANPYFPSDVYNNYTLTSYPYETQPWNNKWGCPDGMSMWDDVGYSRFKDKINAIDSLLIQQPELLQIHSTASEWANYLSLRTDATKEAGVFMASRGGHTYYRAVTLKAPEDATRNLRLISSVITAPNGDIMGSLTRNATNPNADSSGTYIAPGTTLTKGSEYKVTVKVKNMSNYITVAEQSNIDVGYATGKDALSNNVNFSDNSYKNTLSENKVYDAGEVKTFTWTFKVPLETNQKIRVTGLIGSLSTLCQDNTDPNDDDASLIFDVDSGHFSLYHTTLVNTDNEEVTQPTPGDDFKIRYYVKYVGYSIMAFGTNGECVYPQYSIPLNTTVYRNIPPVYNYGDVISQKVAKIDSIKSGGIYTYDTSYQTYEVPVIKATASVSTEMTAIGIRPGGYTTAKKVWREKYDLNVTNVRVMAKTERPYVAGYQTFAVEYDILNTAPSWLNSYDKEVNVAIALGNSLNKTKVHIKKGANKNITEKIQVWVDPKVMSQATLKATVTANWDKMIWEEDLISGME